VTPQFDHEKLNVYQESIRFVSWVSAILESVPASLAVKGQLDRASTSIALNIAEGNGRFTAADRCRLFDIARGSALESAACLDVLDAKKIAGGETIKPGKQMLASIVAMLVGLIKTTSADRAYEQEGGYNREATERERDEEEE